MPSSVTYDTNAPGHARHRPSKRPILIAEVIELQRQRYVGFLEKGDGRLKVIALLARHAQLVSSDLGFDLELGYGNNKNLDGVKGDNDEKWAMLRMRYNLFRGGSDMARISETTHLTNEAREVMSRTQRQVEESTRLSWNAYTSAAERLP